VDNAIAATPEGGRILIECTRQRQGAGGDFDNGGGMEPAVLARAMEA
jgi:signal transduction histidine kinase